MNATNDCRLLAVMLIVVTAGGVAQAQIVIPDGWYRGNTHTHSIANGGDSPPVEVVAHSRDIGYDFLVITEHNLVADCAQYSHPSFLCINGEEITGGSNHLCGLGLTTLIAPGTIQENVDAVLAQGPEAVPQLNHLTYSGLDASDVIGVTGLPLMEIHNALTADYDEAIWDQLLSAGKRVWGTATDDSHQLYSQSGFAWIVVRASSLSQSDILNAMLQGDFYASNGITLNDYYVDSVRMIVDSQDGDQIVFIGMGGQILDTVDGSYGEYEYDGTEGYVRARVESANGSLAWTQPYFLTMFMRGDGTGDGVITLADVAYNLGYLFGDGEALCLDAQDTNDDGAVSLVDPIYSLGYQFAGGPPPPLPFLVCGLDPTSDDLSCGEVPASACP